MKAGTTSYQVELTVLTPLFIGAGDGQVLSPYTDFIEKGGELIVLDQRALERRLAADRALVDEFVEGVRSRMDNTRSTFDLAAFLTNRLKVEPEELASARMPIRGGEVAQKEIRRFIRSAGRPFIPGSSLKGMFRTAILFAWLETDPGQKTLDDLMRLVRQGDSRARFNIAERCFGKIGEDPLRFLGLSDTPPLEGASLFAGAWSRVGVKPMRMDRGRGEESDIPMWTESVREGVKARFEVRLSDALFDRMSFLKRSGLPSLFARINDFSFRSVERELDVFEQADNRRMGRVQDFYLNLHDRVDEVPKDEAYARLGGGKTYFDQSIGLALDDEERGAQTLPAFLAHFGLLRKGKRIMGELDFPSTRTFVMEGNVPSAPPGWVNLKIV